MNKFNTLFRQIAEVELNIKLLKSSPLFFSPPKKIIIASILSNLAKIVLSSHSFRFILQTHTKGGLYGSGSNSTWTFYRNILHYVLC
ncbi:MAG: hypothetical protein II507_07535, partial [Treponema sp.]|nr:hypothetical protein [Treponema sp.]